MNSCPHTMTIRLRDRMSVGLRAALPMALLSPGFAFVGTAVGKDPVAPTGLENREDGAGREDRAAKDRSANRSSPRAATRYAELVDPTTPARHSRRSTGKPEAATSGLSLSAIFVSRGRRAAIVNGKHVRQGDRIGAAEVIEISVASVKIREGRRTFSLSLANASIKHASKHGTADAVPSEVKPHGEKGSGE